MAQDKFDAARFDGGQYDRNEPLHFARFQRTVEEFMVLLRNNDLTYPKDRGLLDVFCKFVDNAEVWHLAQTVAPEFRSAKEDQRRDVDTTDSPTPLDYVLNKLTRLPPPRSDQNVLTTEQDLISQRHKLWVEYTVTGGKGRQAATPGQQAESDERISQIDRKLDEILVQDPIQSTSESAAGEGRNDQDEVESHNVNKEHKGKEEAKKPVDKRPMGDVKKPRKKSIIKQPVVEKGPLDDLLNTVDRP